MVRPKLCFVAEGIIRDADTNAVSAFNIIEVVTPAGLPLFMQRLSCYAFWERDNDDAQRINGQFTVTLAGNILSQSRVTLDFGANLKSKSLVNMSGLILQQSGVLSFRYELEGGVNAEYTVDIAPPPVGAVQAEQNA